MKIRQSAWVLVLILSVSWAGLAQEGRFKSNGALVVSYGGVPLIAGDSVLLMNEAWKKIENLSDAKLTLTMEGEQSVARYDGDVMSTTKTCSSDADGVTVTWDILIKPHPDGSQFELCLSIPAALLDHLPASGQTHDIQRSREKLTLHALTGDFDLDLTGSTFPWSLDDLRTLDWSKQFRLRFAPAYDKEKGLKAKAAIRFRAAPSSCTAFVPLDVAAVGNRGLIDEIDNDGKGGWTDQGSNDMRIFKPGTIAAQAIPYRVAEPVVVLRGGERPAFPKESAEIAVGMLVERLCFLQTAAWSVERGNTVAEYVVRYVDGTEAVVPVRYGLEINDWWSAHAPSHGRVAWTGDNGRTEVGLYAMQWENPAPENAIAGIRMRSTNTPCVPVLLAVTAVKSGVLTAAQTAELDRLFAERDDQSKVDMSDWIPCPIAWNDGIVPGTALDVSFLNDAPSGKYGFLKNKEGHFVFEKGDGAPQRFWATNAALYGPYPEKEDAPGIARCLARQGVNLVRIHLYAVYDDTIIAPDGSANPVALDKMEFFLSQLKKNGIYIYMDLNDGMKFDRLVGHELPDVKKAKLAAIFNRELIEATKKLARMLFTHKNPYTGLRMCDDPAICLYEITNENSVTMDWGGFKKRLCEPWLSELEGLWQAWLEKQGKPVRELPNSFGASDADGRRFGAQLQKAYLDEMKEFLVGLGVKAPICGTNITFTLGDLWASENMDYTNDHAYWDHTGQVGKYRNYNNKSTVLSAAWGAGLLPSFARAKLVGKPTVASEWNYVYPNHHRCEGLPYITAYSAYQDWDAPMFYCATGSFDSGRWARYHETPGILVHSQQTDPATWGLSQISALMFRRRDVAVGTRKLVLRYGPKQVWENESVLNRLKFLPAVARIETELVEKDSSHWPNVKPDTETTTEEVYLNALKQLGDTKSNLERVISDTGELRRDVEEGIFLVDTPRTQIACGRLNRMITAEDRLSGLQINSPNAFATVAAASLDGKPLNMSGRILVAAVANARNSDAVIEEMIIKNMGRKGPVMAEPVQGVLTFSRADSATLHVYALDTLSGERRQELKVSSEKEGISFSISAAQGTIYYEIAAKHGE